MESTTYNALISLAILLATLTGLAFILIKRKFSYWESKGVPCLPIKIPCGHVTDMFLQRASMAEIINKTYTELKAQGHIYVGMYIFTNAVFVPIDRELVKTILSNNFWSHFTDKGIYYNEKSDPLSAHLFSLKLKKWRPLRAKLTPTFTSGKLKKMFQILEDCGQQLNAFLQNLQSRTIDIKDVAARYTINGIGSCAFGIECNTFEDPENEFSKFGKKVFAPSAWQMVKGYLEFSYPDLMLYLDARQIEKDVSNFFMGIVKSTMAYREANNVQRNDFFNLLLGLKGQKFEGDSTEEREDSDGDEKEINVKLTVEEIAAQSFVFFLGGFETSSTTLSFCLFELSRNVEIQEKLRQEIAETLNKHGGKICYESVMDMKYMENVINETLRKYPPIPLLNRECTNDYLVPETGLVIPKGTKMFIPVMAIQRDPEFYPEPDKFDPERFSDKNVEQRLSHTFLPFGEGPRICIGSRFGMMQTKVGLTVLLKNFQYTLNEKTKLPLQMDPANFFMSTKGSIWLDVKTIK